MAAKINDIPDFQAMAKALLQRLPKDVAQKALSHFKGSFRKQGFTDYSFVAWPQRRDELGHKLLRQTDSLMNDLKIKQQTLRRVELGSTLPYAGIHNNGGKFSIRVTEKMRKFFWAMFEETGKEKWKYMALTKKKRIPIRIPQRQFIGHSAVLNKNIDKHITEQIVKTFNSKK